MQSCPKDLLFHHCVAFLWGSLSFSESESLPNEALAFSFSSVQIQKLGLNIPTMRYTFIRCNPITKCWCYCFKGAKGRSYSTFDLLNINLQNSRVSSMLIVVFCIPTCWFTYILNSSLLLSTRISCMCTPFSVMASQAIFTFCEFNKVTTACAEANPPISLIIVQHGMSTRQWANVLIK